MKTLALSLLWLAGLAALGAAIMLGLGGLMFHHLALLGRQLTQIGAAFGADVTIFGLGFGALPGVRASPTNPPKLGPAQAAWAVLGFGALMLAGSLLFANLLTLEDLVLIARHRPARVAFGGRGFLLGTVCAGELSAALWVAWVVRRLGPTHQQDGSASGLALGPAPAAAYVAAATAALAIIGVVLLLFHFIPPDLARLQNVPMARLFTGTGWALLPPLVVALLLAPILEELVFRGIAFAGIAARFGPISAAIVTTLLFMALHAPEKLYYPPGFIDIGLMAMGAAALRLKFRSIRPAILLHILYNLGSILAASWIH